MKRAMILLAAVLLSAAGVQSRAEVPELQPGGIHLHGFMDPYNSFHLDVEMNQAEKGTPPIIGIKVYSEPSHTLLFAFLDDQASVALMTSIQAEKPASMATGTVGAAVMHIQLAPPPGEESRIRLEYLYRQGSGVRTVTMADAQVHSLLAFEFSAEPMSGSGPRVCGYCGGVLCGCVYCTTFSVCCPGCSIVCAPKVCPP
jgi:hypothetical protein